MNPARADALSARQRLADGGAERGAEHQPHDHCGPVPPLAADDEQRIDDQLVGEATGPIERASVHRHGVSRSACANG